MAGSYFLNKGADIEKLVGSANFRWSERQFSWKQQNLNLSDTWTVNARTVNQLRLTYVRHFGGRLNLPAKSLGDLGSTYKIQGAPAGLLFPGDEGVGRGVISADRNNFAPRLGLAWDPFGNGRTSIRAAAGVFYGSISGNEWNASADNQPFAIRQTFYNTQVKTLSDPYKTVPGGVSPFPYDYSPSNPRFLLPASVMGPSLDFRWPYFYQFNFSVQRQVLTDLSVTAAYVGSLGHKLPFQRDVNYPIYGPGATAANVNQHRPFLPGTLAGIGVLGSIMNTAFHSLQTSFDKRMSRRFSLQGSYVWGKALEGARLTNDTTGGGAQNMNNLRAERARTDYDRRHVVLLSGIWEVDYFSGGNPVLRQVLNGWPCHRAGRQRRPLRAGWAR